MVLQVGNKDPEKPKEEFSNVQLSLPMMDKPDEDSEIQNDTSVADPFKKTSFCKIFSIALNLLLIVTVAVLAVRVCSLSKELDELKDREEFEISASKVQESDEDFRLDGGISPEAHEFIRRLTEMFGEGWYKRGVKFIICFRRGEFPYPRLGY